MNGYTVQVVVVVMAHSKPVSRGFELCPSYIWVKVTVDFKQKNRECVCVRGG